MTKNGSLERGYKSMEKPQKKTKYVLYNPNLPKVQDREYTYAETVPIVDGYAFCDSDFACSYLQLPA